MLYFKINLFNESKKCGIFFKNYCHDSIKTIIIFCKVQIQFFRIIHIKTSIFCGITAFQSNGYWMNDSSWIRMKGSLWIYFNFRESLALII